MFLSNRKNKDKLFTPLCKKRINDIVGDIREKAKIEKKITPHSLRRTFATIWYYENSLILKLYVISWDMLVSRPQKDIFKDTIRKAKKIKIH